VEYVEPSYRVFASPRTVRFVEMEYAIPREACAEAVREVRRLVEDRGLLLNFPVEVRFTAADTASLATSHGRATCYVAVHVFEGMPHEPYFSAVEAVMRAHDGRPHWGKLHGRTAADLAPAYPRWGEFQAFRARHDPHGVFRNAYTDRVLGSAATPHT
jgi:FAD/FMN-containing dehydrogenase